LSSILDSLRVPPPVISQAEASHVALHYFGVSGNITFLGGERDSNFLIRSDKQSVTLKIANPAEDDSILDMQCLALQHIGRYSIDTPVPRVIQTLDGSNWATLSRESGEQLRARVFTYMEGTPIPQGASDSGLLFNLGKSVADVNMALRGYMHSAAQHSLAWNTQAFEQLCLLTEHIRDADERQMVELTLQRFRNHVKPYVGNCRSQVIHNDITYHNTVLDPQEMTKISGIYDFGDMVYGPLIQDLANPASEVPAGSRDPLSGSARVIAGFHSVLPLEDLEFRLLPELMAARLASCMLLEKWADEENSWTDERDHLDNWYEKCATTLRLILDTPALDIENLFRSSCGLSARLNTLTSCKKNSDKAWALRQKYLGNANYVAYDKPIHMAKGEGVWLYGVDGKRYLDVYNNVPHVGHCHPRITDAINKQTATLNTNTRYVYDVANQYAERITSTLPEGLDTCYLVSSGSEANDLAWRLATTWTGNQGGLVLDNAYHGITEITFALSPAEYRFRNRSFPHIATFSGPDDFRGEWKRDDPQRGRNFAQYVNAAIHALGEQDYKPAALFLDMVMSSNGIFTPPQDYLETLFDRVKNAGGLCVADEVQSGFGRTGKHMWGFEFGNVTPDIVTFGKPIAGGYPMGLVVTRKEIARHFEKQGDFFSTTGGNPVACAAAMAMLDVLQHEQLMGHAETVGDHLIRSLRELSAEFPIIGDIRGSGLFVGVELITNRETLEPATEQAGFILNELSEDGVLIGRDGVNHNVLKIRPPMVFSYEHVEIFIEKFRKVLGRAFI